MTLSRYLLVFSFIFTAVQAQAQSILPAVSRDIGATATANIEQAERLFCYQVSAKPQNYKGYTLNNMAITGFCGVVDDNLKNMLTEQLLSTEDNIDFINTENCTIAPRVLLRYVRGVDNTDILLSAPCHSISVFYAGTLKTFNMKPAAELLDTVVNAFKSNQASFVSPALLNQLMPIGVVQTNAHRNAIAEQAQPKHKWDTPANNNTQQNTGGWNSLNFSK